MLRNWLMGRTSYDVSATDLRVSYEAADFAGAPVRVAQGGIHVGPIGGPGTFDYFPGSSGNDHIVGTDNEDDIDVSQGGNDTVEGRGGDDTVSFGGTFTAADHVDGGSGNFDVVGLSGNYSAGVVFAKNTIRNVERLDLLGADQGLGGGNYSITLNDGNVAAGSFLEIDGFQTSTGTNYFDLDGSAETNGDLILNTFGRGNDHLTGGGGNDLINGGVGGDDVMDGGAGWNRVSFSRAVTSPSSGVTVSLALQGVAQDVGGGRMVTLDNFQALSGSSRDDVLTGDDQANYINTLGGSDTVDGAGGDDTIVISALIQNTYAASATGGSGNDTLVFVASRTTPITFSLDLQGTSQQIGDEGTLTASGFENVAGSVGTDDILIGDSAINALYGDGGNDTLHGGGGNDSLFGDKAFFLIASSSGGGSTGTGSFDRGSGDDVLQGGAGDDSMDGGLGNDTADYSDASGSGVTVDLGVSIAQDVGGGLGSDTLSSIENLIGSDFDDTLTGDGNANRFEGGLGNDAIDAGFGSDTVFGGDGGDTLDGSDGGDFLVGDQVETMFLSGFEIVSTADDGTPGDDHSFEVQFSPDATRIVFGSYADNLDGADPEFQPGIFVKNLVTGDITRVAGTPSGDLEGYHLEHPYFSPSGGKVVFDGYFGSDSLNQQIYVANLATGNVTQVSTTEGGDAANGLCRHAEFLDDRHVIFGAEADNLVAGAVNGIFLKDLKTGAVTDFSTTEAGDPVWADTEFFALSDDHTKLVFASYADNLVAGDTNDTEDIFVKDLVTGEVTLVSVAADGTQGNNISAQMFDLSGDGTEVLFASFADNLIEGVPNQALLMKNLVTGELTPVIRTPDGSYGGGAFEAMFSPDDSMVAYLSHDDNLVAGDGNGLADLFVTDLATGTTTRLTTEENLGDDFYVVGSFDWSGDATTMVVEIYSEAFPGAGSLQMFVVPVAFKSAPGGSDVLNGGDGADVLVGGTGADMLDGGAGGDTFVYRAVTDSTSTGFDTIAGFNGAADSIDAPFEVTSMSHRIRHGALSDATFDSDLESTVNASRLKAHGAVVFRPTGGDHRHDTFLIVDNNGTAGYQAGEDFVMQLLNATHLKALHADTFV